MSDDQDGCEWVSVSSGTSLPGLSQTKAVKRLCVCVIDIATSMSCLVLLYQKSTKCLKPWCQYDMISPVTLLVS